MIKILDENTINKIAAGEVIENPNNIVKELIENAIDAKATHITVCIENGGKTLIKVIDDGKGFDRDDIKLAFTEHATSKLSDFSDIYSISSYGFRGEALPSIAAVSKVTLKTLYNDNDKSMEHGYEYQIEYGKPVSFSETATNMGTTIIVENLFENVPVRRKFLKSDQKESADIETTVIKFAFSSPHISFRFIRDGVEKFKTAGDSNIKSVIYTFYGKTVYDRLLDIDSVYKDIKVSGYIAKPEVTRGNRNDEIYFVNGRMIQNDTMKTAIENAYSEYLMQHKFPFCVISIEIDSALVDVNVHPKKLEVRFSNEQDVYMAIYNAIHSKLRESELIHMETFDVKNSDSATTDDIGIPKDDILQDEYDRGTHINITELPTLKSVLHKEMDASIDVSNAINTLFGDNKYDIKILPNIKEKPFISSTLTEDHRYIGQIFDTYILIEYMDKLYIIDQHAAHEKINFEKLMNSYRHNDIILQKIFPSIMLKLTPVQYEALTTNVEEFKKLGFEIETFGDNDIKIDAVPYNIVNVNMQDYLFDIINTFASNEYNVGYDTIVERIASISCKKAIKANHKLTEVEVKELLRELFKLDNPYNCPHGRPTIISFTKTEFEKRFGRIVE